MDNAENTALILLCGADHIENTAPIVAKCFNEHSTDHTEDSVPKNPRLVYLSVAWQLSYSSQHFAQNDRYCDLSEYCPFLLGHSVWGIVQNIEGGEQFILSKPSKP
jgi:hypothetical protein